MLEKGGLSFLRSEGSSQEHTDHPCFLPASGMFVNQKDRNPLPFFLSLLPFLSPSVIWANLRQVSSFGPNHPQWVKGGGGSSSCTDTNSDRLSWSAFTLLQMKLSLVVYLHRIHLLRH